MSANDNSNNAYLNNIISKIESHFDPDQQISAMLTRGGKDKGDLKSDSNIKSILDHPLVTSSSYKSKNICGDDDDDDDFDDKDKEEHVCGQLRSLGGVVVHGLNPTLALSEIASSQHDEAFDTTSWDSARLLEHFLMDEDEDDDDDDGGRSGRRVIDDTVEKGSGRSPDGKQQLDHSYEVAACVTFEGGRNTDDDNAEKYSQVEQRNSKIATAVTTDSYKYDDGMNCNSLLPVVSFGAMSTAVSVSSNFPFGTTAADGCFDVEYVNSLRNSPTPFDLPTYRDPLNKANNASIDRQIEYEKISGRPKATKKKVPSSRSTRSTSKNTKVVNRVASERWASTTYNANQETRHQSWTSYEDNLLKHAVSAIYHDLVKPTPSGHFNWDIIGEKFLEMGGNRSASQCRTRYPKLIFKQGQWDRAEDDYIKKKVKELGTGKWAVIAKGLSNRRSDAIRDRWVNQLDPRIVKSPMDQLETRLLFQWVSILGNEWSTIAALMYVFRTPNQCKNRYNNQTKAFQFKRRASSSTSANFPIPPTKTRKVFKIESLPVNTEHPAHDNSNPSPLPVLVTSFNAGFTSINIPVKKKENLSADVDERFEI